MPATTVTTTMTTMLVVRSSDPIPPSEAFPAVFAGARLVVGFGGSKIWVKPPMESLEPWVSGPNVVDVSVCPSSGAGCLPGVSVVSMAGPVVVIDPIPGSRVLSVSVLTSLRPGVRGWVSSLVKSASTHRI
jgi:hypothetical protein